jgi:L-serine dehydratase
VSLSVFDLFKIGIGPSSSHTVGPMRAARRFVSALQSDGLLRDCATITAELFGSLGATGRGHGSPKAVVLGLLGETPEAVDPDRIDALIQQVIDTRELCALGQHTIRYDIDTDIVLHRRQSLPFHPNGMTFSARSDTGAVLRERTYFSVGGGFVVDESATGGDRVVEDSTSVPYPFRSGAELLQIADSTGRSISGVMLSNEAAWRPEADTRAGLLEIWQVMQECVRRGCETPGLLPGGLRVRRRAHQLRADLQRTANLDDPLQALDWVNLYALAVNEENAAGGRVVTAPTNGAAGIIPAVLHYFHRFVPGADDDATVRFLLTAGAIGVLVKENASISGAEVGCQGEVGSACAMAAGALAEVLGGTPQQVENAAEIGMEHNLGLTCDPIGGLVQIPCIERNAVAAVKAITAARMALNGDGTHHVSLDKVIRTMRITGADMLDKYKETSRGGLAVNIVEC